MEVEFKFKIGNTEFHGKGFIVSESEKCFTLDIGGKTLLVLKEHIWKV